MAEVVAGDIDARFPLRNTLRMTNTAPSKLLPRLWQSTLLAGLLAVLLGVLVLLWPGISILAASVLFGIYLLASGVAQVIFAFGLHVTAGARILLFLSGGASLILAVLAFRHFGEGYAMLLLAIWIAVGFIFRGVATTASALSEPGLPGRGWMIFAGVISLIGGTVVLAWPFDSIVILAVVAGSWLIVIGVFEIVSAFQIRKAAKTITDADRAARAVLAA
jgi:uncharacterized membrane protein HdeD (DUF308 family)